MDTCFNYCCGTAYFSSDERKWINKILQLASDHPDEVTILEMPEDNDGVIYASLPSNYFVLRPKIKRTFTHEQLEAMRTRLENGRKKHKLPVDNN